MLTREHPLQRTLTDAALQPERPGSGTEPLPVGLSATEVVVLHTRAHSAGTRSPTHAPARGSSRPGPRAFRSTTPHLSSRRRTRPGKRSRGARSMRASLATSQLAPVRRCRGAATFGAAARSTALPLILHEDGELGHCGQGRRALHPSRSGRLHRRSCCSSRAGASPAPAHARLSPAMRPRRGPGIVRSTGAPLKLRLR
jgi:hypothetical protein